MCVGLNMQFRRSLKHYNIMQIADYSLMTRVLGEGYIIYITYVPWNER